MIKRKIFQYDNNLSFKGTYNSIAEAAAILNVDESTVRKAIDQKYTKFGAGYYWSSIPLPNINYSDAKILLFDIETSPTKAWIWNFWNTNIYQEQVLSDWLILTWAAKWLNHKSIMSSKITPRELQEENDRRLTEELWYLFDEADIIIAHYGKKFDIPRFKAKCVLYELPPLNSHIPIDTKEAVNKIGYFPSKKLDDLSKYLSLQDRKIETKFELWSKSMEGDEESLSNMETYNIRDVKILEDLYLRIRPYMTNHPNLGLFSKHTNVCPICGYNDLTKEDIPTYKTNAKEYYMYRCNACGAINPERLSTSSKQPLKIKSRTK